MPRTKGGYKTRQRHKRVLKKARGYRGARSRLFATATSSVDRALHSAFSGRKQKKRSFRNLWITRINAGVRPLQMNYSQLIHGLKNANVELDRCALADLAMNQPKDFEAVVALAKEHA